MKEILQHYNDSAVFFMSIEDATKCAIKELQKRYGQITWGFATEQLSKYPYLLEGVRRLRKKLS